MLLKNYIKMPPKPYGRGDRLRPLPKGERADR